MSDEAALREENQRLAAENRRLLAELADSRARQSETIRATKRAAKRKAAKASAWPSVIAVAPSLATGSESMVVS